MVLKILSESSQLPLRGYHTLRHTFPDNFRFLRLDSCRQSSTPHLLYLSIKDSVCLVLFSLAVTSSISIDFFSCGYLDVSIPRVPPPYGANEKSHSGISGSMAACASPEHFAACRTLHQHLSQVIHLIA